jgi:hypothetical protein
LVTRRVPCRHRPKALEREAANADEQIINSEGDGDEEWIATHTNRHLRHPTVTDAAGIPDIEMEDATAGGQDEDMRDMDIDDIPGLEDMQMPSDDESDNETNRKLYFFPSPYLP